MIIPPYLKKGDNIGFTCPAGYMEYANAKTCIHTLQEWGYNVMVGKTLGSKSKTYFSGTDTERADELQAMLDDESIKAILCGRGGYGTGRIVDLLNFVKFQNNPKWVIGFSDITVLHSHINKELKIATLHAPMAAAFNDGGYKNEFVLSLKNALSGKKANYTAKPFYANLPGKATGKLTGGNLALITHLIGTKSDVKTKNKILFLEDIGEQLYNVDRMMYQLIRSGKLDQLAGLILGGFADCKDTDRPFGKKTEQILQDIIGAAGYPVCYKFPVSHKKDNYALKCGGTYTLTVQKNGVRLKEL
jgi:muramoyltetrapeptide carboxypeptidase